MYNNRYYLNVSEIKNTLALFRAFLPNPHSQLLEQE